ncbi:helix-turn-helix transcriptional regulator [Candidatus Liberibacter africanus]|uniref:Transcriptional regulator n=1 Tax=Candidatus Liberibacter africanus PTSAPSY TaxID=1277257 RepID=A0A0G3I7K4_LIBAF|nr:helix-turn-helix transcriptional regulator [Candidatus Liberibacter africanus]AKK19702.1 transcriptional regulator [Candidatus Liberibacter africanus PTSAPSY]QTP63586.1 helix-turn-helix transcriptional regulator [Candidatus Liberibacter africanus]
MPRRKKNNLCLADDTILRERMIFVQNFRNTRKKAKMTQKAIKECTGFAQSWISELETGKSTINIDNMIILAHILDTPLWKLLKP